MNLTPEEAAEIADRAHVASWGGVGGAGLGWLMSDSSMDAGAINTDVGDTVGGNETW